MPKSVQGFFMEKRDLIGFIMGSLLLLLVWFISGRAFYEALSAGEASAVAAEISDIQNENQKITVVIDPGHGGVDPGKVGCRDIYEKDLNLKISYTLKGIFESEGYNVLMTRTEDGGLYEESAANKKMSDMKERCNIIKEASADYVISIHMNSFSDSRVRGPQVFYYKHSSKGKELAEAISENLKEMSPEYARKCKSDSSYYMLLHTPCPTVIVECGFISNPEETLLLQEEEYQAMLCNAIYEGFAAYLEKK